MGLIPAWLRQDLKRRDGSYCRYCGRRVFPHHGRDCLRPEHCLRKRTADHLVPQAQGGETNLANLVTACLGCNEAKGNQLPVDPWAPLPVPDPPIFPREPEPCGCERLMPRSERLGHTSWEEMMADARVRLLRTHDDSIAPEG